MNWLDKVTERASRRVAQGSSRRSWLAGLGGALVGAGALPLLPVARAAGPAPSNSQNAGQPQLADIPDPDDDTVCDYWRYCAIDGFLCSCCGGTVNACPPGTEMSPITWIGTCLNPADQRKYVISYNDCCGKSSCGNCFCNTNEGDRPMYVPPKSNDINWCLGTESSLYHCSTAIIVGVATE